MSLSELLRQLRNERGWTQLEAASESGLERSYISYLEQSQSNKRRPSAKALAQLARAYNVKIERLYEAAGYIESSRNLPRPETPEEILDRLRLATPISIPVYSWEDFPFRAGDTVEPQEYVYISRRKLGNRRVEAYIVRGHCLEPKINDGDVIVVDRDGVVDNGDIVACLLEGEFHVLRVRNIAGEVWLENNYKKFKAEDCQHIAPVIECIRRLK